MREPPSWPALVAMLVMGLASGACEGEAGPTVHGEHVEFFVQNEDRELCVGTVAHLDSYIERVFAFLESPVPEHFIVPVRVVDDAPGARSACYCGDASVYIQDLDWTGARPAGILRHELTHAVVDRVWGWSLPFFTEGLAEAMGRNTATSWIADSLVPVGDMLDKEARDVDYTAAARFTRFLIDTRGLARYKQLYQGATVRTQESIRGLFFEVYGESFDDLEAEYLSGSRRCQYQIDLCDSAAAVPVGDVWSVELAASCLDPDFYGSVGSDDFTIATQRTITLEGDGVYRLQISGDVRTNDGKAVYSQVMLARCGDCDGQFFHVYLEADALVELTAGLYTLEYEPVGESVLKVGLERVGDLPAP